MQRWRAEILERLVRGASSSFVRVDLACAVLDAALGEIITTCSKLDWLINHGEGALSPESRHNNLIMFYKSSWVQYEPLGVVAAITSWNYRKHFLPYMYFFMRAMPIDV